jgi:hypothetical protein
MFLSANLWNAPPRVHVRDTGHVAISAGPLAMVMNPDEAEALKRSLGPAIARAMLLQAERANEAEARERDAAQAVVP